MRKVLNDVMQGSFAGTLPVKHVPPDTYPARKVSLGDKALLSAARSVVGPTTTTGDSRPPHEEGRMS
jgi:hypothetical protein